MPVDELLASADEPESNDASGTLQDLLIVLGIEPSIERGLEARLYDHIVSGDAVCCIRRTADLLMPFTGNPRL